MRFHDGEGTIDRDLYQRLGSLLIKHAAHPLTTDVNDIVECVVQSASTPAERKIRLSRRNLMRGG